MSTMIQALLVRPGEMVEWVAVPADQDGSTLAGLQALVGGFIEAVSLGDEAVMWANEEGYILAAAGQTGFGPNWFATGLAAAANGSWSTIVGPCVITGSQGSQTVSLPREHGSRILDMFASAQWSPA